MQWLRMGEIHKMVEKRMCLGYLLGRNDITLSSNNVKKLLSAHLYCISRSSENASTYRAWKWSGCAYLESLRATTNMLSVHWSDWQQHTQLFQLNLIPSCPSEQSNCRSHPSIGLVATIPWWYGNIDIYYTHIASNNERCKWCSTPPRRFHQQ